jgi:hypothetical protein
MVVSVDARRTGFVVSHDQPVERDPLTARRLTVLRQSGAALPGLLAEREMVPDFSLVDQARRPTRLSQFRGKVVAVNFIYTSCPLPHSLRTAVIGRDGRLAANIEGNLYASAQLGDLVQAILAR